MKISFHKTGELEGSSYVKIPLRSNALLNIQNVDKHCFNWYMLAYIHPFSKGHPTRVNNCLQYFKELNIDGFDCTNDLKCSIVPKFEKLNNLCIDIFELNIYENKNKWKQNLISIEFRKNESDKVVKLLKYKNHYALIKKLNLFLGDHHKTFICRGCLKSYTSENA